MSAFKFWWKKIQLWWINDEATSLGYNIWRNAEKSAKRQIREEKRRSTKKFKLMQYFKSKQSQQPRSEVYYWDGEYKSYPRHQDWFCD